MPYLEQVKADLEKEFGPEEVARSLKKETSLSRYRWSNFSGDQAESMTDEVLRKELPEFGFVWISDKYEKLNLSSPEFESSTREAGIEVKYRSSNSIAIECSNGNCGGSCFKHGVLDRVKDYKHKFLVLIGSINNLNEVRRECNKWGIRLLFIPEVPSFSKDGDIYHFSLGNILEWIRTVKPLLAGKLRYNLQKLLSELKEGITLPPIIMQYHYVTYPNNKTKNAVQTPTNRQESTNSPGPPSSCFMQIGSNELVKTFPVHRASHHTWGLSDDQYKRGKS